MLIESWMRPAAVTVIICGFVGFVQHMDTSEHLGIDIIGCFLWMLAAIVSLAAWLVWAVAT